MTAKIMIIDDDILICQLLTYQLSGVGYTVCTLQDGREALERLPVEQPDLILLDVMMPTINGWDVCRQIRTCNYSSVPIIMLTSKESESDEITGLTVGADDYVTKPYKLNHLLARIEAVLRRARRLNTPQIKSGGGVSHQTKPSSGTASNTAYPAQPSLASTLPRPSVAVEPQPASSGRHSGIGQRLAAARKLRGLTLYQAEQYCGIRWEFLQALEYEHFNYIPRPQLRQTLRAYSMYLGVDLKEFVPTGPQRKPSADYRRPTLSVALVSSLAFMLVLVLGLMLSLDIF